MRKIKVGIIGHSGRLGKPLTEILGAHPYAEIVYTENRSKGGLGRLSETELVFLALPHGESQKYLARLDNIKIIDLSLDHRNGKSWTYGLSEIFRDEIKGAVRVANPGCYATSVLLGLYPLKGKIKSVNISSTSGISGAGIEVHKNDNFLIYKEGNQHPQIKEMEKILKISKVLFVPQRIDTSERGIISTIFVQVNKIKEVKQLYREYYKECPFIRVKEQIETKNVIETNYCDIEVLEFGKDVVIISALDNLIKGGAGQAVQNFNLMYNFEETLGLI